MTRASTVRPCKKIFTIIKKQGFQRELVPFGRGLGGQRPPTTPPTIPST